MRCLDQVNKFSQYFRSVQEEYEGTVNPSSWGKHYLKKKKRFTAVEILVLRKGERLYWSRKMLLF